MALSIEDVAATRAQLWDGGFRPIAICNWDDASIPLAARGKRPLDSGWQHQSRLNPPRAAVAVPTLDQLNTGILADGLRPFDIDINDPDLAGRVRAIIFQMLGFASARFRSDSGRSLVLYRAADGEPTKRVLAGKLGKVEVLGHGQQFVAFGTHASGADLYWHPDAPGIEVLDSLIPVTEEQVTEVFAAIAPLIEAELVVNRRATPGNGADHAPPDYEGAASAQGAKTSDELAADDPLLLISALQAIPNSAAEPANWDVWNECGMALWAGTGGSPLGRQAWHAWSARHPSYDPKHTQERWDHYFRSPPTRIGAGSIYYRAERHGWSRPLPAMLRPPLPGAGSDGTGRGEAGETGEARGPGDADTYAATPFTADLLGHLHPYDWAYQKIMVARFFTALGATPGTGKSALIVAIALSIATGRALLGGEAPRQGNVWIINLEDPAEAVYKMIWAACQFYRIDPNNLQGKLFVNSGRDKALIVARLVNGAVLRMPVVENLTAECARLNIRALFIDPVVDTHNLPENDNVTMNEYCAIWNHLADHANIAVLLSMHFRKGGQTGDPDAFRGASAIIGKARSAVTLGVMSESEAEKLKIPSDKRRYHLRMDNAKRNLSPPPANAEWLRLESIELPVGDNIQALTAWTPPSPWEGLSAEQSVNVLEIISGGTKEGEFYTKDRRGRMSDRWAGNVVLQCGDATILTTDKAKIIINQWLKNGVLVETTYHSPSRREVMPCVQVDPDKFNEIRSLVTVIETAEWQDR